MILLHWYKCSLGGIGDSVSMFANQCIMEETTLDISHSLSFGLRTKDIIRLLIATCCRSHGVFMRQMNKDKLVKLTTSICTFHATTEVSMDTNQTPYDICGNYQQLWIQPGKA